MVNQGFGQIPGSRELGWAFIVENPNEDKAIERSEYQVVAADGSGTVLETDSGYLDLLLPGERLGVSGTIYLPDGVTASVVDVSLNPGSAESIEVTSPFTSSQVVWHADEYTPKVAGVIANPFSKDLEDLRVSAIAYDANGAIIGGGFTYLNFVLANGQSPVQVSVTSSADPASVELYASITSLTSLAASVDEDKPEQPLVLEASGYGVDAYGAMGWGFVVQNPNDAHAVDSSKYIAAAFDDAGNVIGVDSGYITLITPSERLGVGGSLYLADGSAPARLEIQVLAGEASSMDTTQFFSTENVAFVPGDYSQKVTGIVKNLTDVVLENIRVSAIAYDGAGQIIGGGFTYVDFVPAQGQAAADVSIDVNGVPARVELFPGVSSLTDLDP